jgi:hypothetical protein
LAGANSDHAGKAQAKSRTRDAKSYPKATPAELARQGLFLSEFDFI